MVAFWASSSGLASLIASMHAALPKLGSAPVAAPAELHVPAISIRKSVPPDVIIYLEDGLPFKSMKRHIGNKYGLTPVQYRTKWGLTADYPMVAPTRTKVAAWIADFNTAGRHSALGYVTPAAYAANFTAPDDLLRNPDQLRRSPIAPTAPEGAQTAEALTSAG